MRDLIAKFLGYFLTGGFAAIIDIGGFALLLTTKIAVGPAAAASFCVAILVNFQLISRFVFKQNATARRFFFYLLGALVGLVVNVGITVAGTDFLALPEIAAKIFGVGTAFLVNFALNVAVVFRKKKLPLS